MLGEFCELCDGGIKRKAKKKAQTRTLGSPIGEKCVCVRCTLGQLVKLRVENALRDGDAAHGLIAFRHGGQQRLVQPARELRGLVDAVFHFFRNDCCTRGLLCLQAAGIWDRLFREGEITKGVPIQCSRVFEN